MAKLDAARAETVVGLTIWDYNPRNGGPARHFSRFFDALYGLQNAPLSGLGFRPKIPGKMSPTADTAVTGALGAAVRRLLRPLVRILLRYGIPYGVFADLAKGVYIEVAGSDFTIDGRKQTISRVSILTGISRKEVRRVKALARPDDAGAVERYNRAARVISGWVRDPRFSDRGRPAALVLEDAPNSFSELVREFSGDVPPRAILDELERVGAVKRLRDGRIRLTTRAYVPTHGHIDKIGILGIDVADLISCIDHNLQAAPEDTFFQRKVSYDNLPGESTAEIRAKSNKLAQKTLERLDDLMSRHDRDTNPDAAGTGRKRVSLGIYYYEEDYPTEDS